MTPERLQEIRAYVEDPLVVILNGGADEQDRRISEYANGLTDALADALDYIDLLHEDVRAAKAAAWDEGRERGYFDRAADEYHGQSVTIPNPYRKDTE